jgi:hypothetical protein
MMCLKKPPAAWPRLRVIDGSKNEASARETGGMENKAPRERG